MLHSMGNDGRKYLDQLADSTHNGFERRFSRISTRLALSDDLTEPELRLLYDATLYSTLCNIAFNGLGGCNGQIKPEREPHRISIERRHMLSRNKFYNSTGWKALPELKQASIRTIFLNVFVTVDNLAQ